MIIRGIPKWVIMSKNSFDLTKTSENLTYIFLINRVHEKTDRLRLRQRKQIRDRQIRDRQRNTDKRQTEKHR